MQINGVYSRDNLPKIKEINRIALNGNGNNGSVSYNVIYFDRIGVEDKRKQK